MPLGKTRSAHLLAGWALAAPLSWLAVATPAFSE